MNRLIAKYEDETGGDAKADHPEWNPAHKVLLGANIPTIEQVGGDVDDLRGKRATMMATPWRSEHGEACPVRFVAMTDPSGNCRIDAGLEE